MRALRNTLVVGGLLAASLTAAHAAGAAAPETARPGTGRALEHVEMPVQGQNGKGVPPEARTTATRTSNGISYHGGPVMNAPINAYVIWYGNWGTDSATTILPDFLRGIGGSPYFNINTTYADGAGRKVPNAVALAGQTSDTGSVGTSNLSDAAIQTVVANAISAGRLPKDANSVYFVLTATNVTKTGFLTQYCGWHTHATIGGTDVKYSFVGNPGANTACAAQTTSPNGNPGADAMASIIAHELEEAATDPALNAWYDSRGYENGDKCAWTFGTTYSVANGAKANMKLGTRDYLVQRNWVNAGGGYCALAY